MSNQAAEVVAITETTAEMAPESKIGDAVADEQAHLSMLYRRVDDLREQASERLAAALKQTGGTHQARYERNAAIAMHSDQIAQFDLVEEGLCFGRLDFDENGDPGSVGSPSGDPDGGAGGEGSGDSAIRHIGRIGIFDPDNDYEPLLLDWRAPAARPFYVATAAAPEGVRRRRHIRTRGRVVTEVHDETLDLDAAAEAGHDEGLTGEAALLAALNAGRTGRMTDIVQTIQAEQDRVIRSDLRGVLVVQGGPGTGKTAVALHRAAYLLYTHRDQLAKRGVLVVGPNPTFLRYVSQVLPSLAETGVLLQTLGELFPGVVATRAEPPETAEVKGRASMRRLIANAVADRQRLPDEPIEAPAEIGYSTEVVRIDPAAVEQARHRARRSRKPHNLARPVFVREMVKLLTRQLARRIGDDPYGGNNLLDQRDVAELREGLRDSPEIRAALEDLWPLLTPQQLLTDLYACSDALASAAPRMKRDERRLLHRPAAAAEPGADPSPEGGWTPADVPLLDEAAELLGEDDSVAKALAERARRERIGYAEGVLDLMAGSRSFDFEDEEDEVLVAMDLLRAEDLAERQEERDYRTTAERAAEDRTWAYGHIIVDEAQELSPMAWRLLMRRSPSRSMTIVGDVAQTGDLAGISSWERALEPYAPGRWRQEELTISYRTPAEIMEVAAEVLTEIDPSLRVPRAVRATGVPPRRLAASRADLATLVGEVAAGEAELVGEGRVGVIVPAALAGELGAELSTSTPDIALGENPELRSRVVMLTVRQAKGLEFDSVVVVHPEGIKAESRRGSNDLYVALTRATQRLTTVNLA